MRATARPGNAEAAATTVAAFWIVDVNGEVVVIDIAYYEGTPQSVIDEMEAIVASTTFE